MKHPGIWVSVIVLITIAAGGLVWQWSERNAGGPISMGDTAAAPEFYDAGPFRVRADISPEVPRVGKNQLTVFVQDRGGDPVTGATLKAVATMPAMGSMPAMHAPADMRETAPGRYEGEFEPPMSGEWPLTIEIKAAAGTGRITFDLATGRRGLHGPGGGAMADVPGTVHVDPVRRQLIGITTGRVEQRNLLISIRAPGVVTYDETRLSDIALKFGGWIGELHADFTGKPVAKGQPLFTVYSPELLTAQQEYLETLRRVRAAGSGGEHLLDAGRRRLRLWDLGDAQIDRLERRGSALEYVPVLAPTDGVVIDKSVVTGSAFTAGQRLLRIADLSRVWIEAWIHEHELSLIEPGMPATITVAESPERQFRATIDYVYPFMDEATRTARVRLVLDNAAGRLLPDMYAGVRLEADLGRRLVVPEEAVLYAGETRLVFVDLGDGRLAPRKIATGQRNQRWIEVVDGLAEGDTIVTSGNFLIAAESKLKSGIAAW